jgi:hypothetical protein
MADIFYNEITTESNKKIKVYDNLFDFEFRQKIYRFVDSCSFKIGWADKLNSNYRFLHSCHTKEEIINLDFLKKLENTPLIEDIKEYVCVNAVTNLSVASDSYFVHSHQQKLAVLYYVNLEWEDGWHGETLFYDESGKDIIFASSYTPGRVIVFDSTIPHAIRPQSIIATKFRFTLALFFN